jgi:hypothetical protein
MSADKDAGAFIGAEPELAADQIPGGIRRQDERVAATQSEPVVHGEPEGDDDTSKLRDLLPDEDGLGALDDEGAPR